MTDDATRQENHISRLGIVVLTMAMISLTVVLWTSYQDRVSTQCQKDLNSRFLVVLRDRATIADGDRTAVRNLVKELTEAQTEAQSAEAIAKYDAANKILDKQREKVIYPADTELCN